MIRVVVAAAVLCIVAALLVVPFHPEAALLGFVHAVTPDTTPARRVDWFLVESGGNFLVFAMVGLAALVLVRRAGVALVLGCLLSAAAESVQLLLPSRVASWTDLLTNCLGAAAGVGATVVVTRALHRRRVD